MKKTKLKNFFVRSTYISLLRTGINYTLTLFCGYLVSDLLQDVLAKEWHGIVSEIGFTTIALFLSIVPLYCLSVWYSYQKMRDTESLREYLYSRVIDRSMPIENLGEMNVRFQKDVNTISAYFQQTLPQTISGILIMICSGVLLCAEHMMIGVIFFTLNFIQLIPIFVYEKWAIKIYNRTHTDEEKYRNWILEGYNGIRTIKAYQVENWFMTRYNKLNQTILQSGKQAEKTGTIEDIVYHAINAVIGYGRYAIIGAFVIMGKAEIASAPLLIILSDYLFSSIRLVFDGRLMKFEYKEACKRISLTHNFEKQEFQDIHLTVKHIKKCYGEKNVLKDISFEIHSGDKVWLEGPNGSGKSTLMRILSGTETPDTGSVFCSVPRQRRTILLQEEPDLNITGFELAEALIQQRGISREIFEQHICKLKIDGLLNKSLSQLSPGEQKKFYLAVALSHGGELMILDEPTNHLDQNSIQYLVQQLKSFSGTLLVSTHEDGLSWGCNRIIRLEEGVCHEVKS